MRGASTESLADAVAQLGRSTDGRSDDEMRGLGDELFAVVGLLHSSIGLRRSLSDPSRSADDKAAFVRRLLSGQLSETALELTETLVRGRWSSPVDLVDAAEILAVHATIGAAATAGRLDAVEDDLFRFRRIVDGQRDLRLALTDPTVAGERKEALLEQLLGDRTSRETRALLRQVFVSPRGRSFDRVLDEYGEIAAQRRNRVIARVTSAVSLTDAQCRRLRSALRRLYGHEVHLDLDLDPDLLGGIRVQIGDEVIDGSLALKLESAKRRLEG
jgi:F-type H+-transporting ATPase subunit delta